MNGENIRRGAIHPLLITVNTSYSVTCQFQLHNFRAFSFLIWIIQQGNDQNTFTKQAHLANPQDEPAPSPS
jgi:hypothetical protein